ncbi:hypothetical protein [Haloferula sp.]|uniref:hypothetical protein n=1 Tax=Haloferula sp. TaxID=2497595 RepID=UPI00329BCCCE
MNQRIYVVVAGMMAFGSLLFLLTRVGGKGGLEPNENYTPPGAAKPVRIRPEDDGRSSLRRRVSTRSEIGELRDELERTKSELASLSTPLNENDVLSSAVNAVVGQGESLVTGGYQLSDGRYELTFITPKAVGLEGGESGLGKDIMLEIKSMVVNDAFVETSGLDTLATNARNTLQHAEAWSGDDVFNTFKSASEAEGVDMGSSPTVTTRPNEPFIVEMLDGEGRGFSLRGEADFMPDGSFAVKARAERRE